MEDSRMNVDAGNDTHKEHPLKSPWTLWYHKKDCTRSQDACLTKFCTVSTVEQLISALESIEWPSRLTIGSEYYLFKEGIKPIWSEEDNVHGGQWTISIDKRYRQTKMNNYWAELVCAMVGEQFGRDGDQICGAAVGVRFRMDKIYLWTRDAVTSEAEETNKRIGARMAEKLKLEGCELNSMTYESHKSTWKRKEG